MMPRHYSTLIALLVLVKVWTAQCKIPSRSNETLCMNVTSDPGLSCGEKEAAGVVSSGYMCHTFHSHDAVIYPRMMFKSEVEMIRIDQGNISNRKNVSLINCKGQWLPSPIVETDECYHFSIRARNMKHESKCDVKLELRKHLTKRPLWKRCVSLNVTDAKVTLFIHFKEMKSDEVKISYLTTVIVLVVLVLLIVILIVAVLALRTKTAQLHIHIDPVPPIATHNPTVREMVRSNSLDDHIYEEVSLNNSGMCCNVENDPSPHTLELDGAGILNSTSKK